MMEYYEIFLNSADANSGSSTPHSCRFNLGSAYDFVPNLYKYQDANYCFVKVKYFSVEETASAFSSAGIGTIVIECNRALPNSVRSKSLTHNTTTNISNSKNMVQSGVIGLVPTSVSDNTYSSNTFDNDFVKCSNILNGDMTINLKSQDDGFLSLTGSKAWVMLLCIAFEKDNHLENINIGL